MFLLKNSHFNKQVLLLIAKYFKTGINTLKLEYIIYICSLPEEIINRFLQIIIANFILMTEHFITLLKLQNCSTPEKLLKNFCWQTVCQQIIFRRATVLQLTLLLILQRVWGKKLSGVEWSGAEWSHGVEWNLCNKS